VSVTTAVELLLFTGYRLSEVLNLRWEQVDFEGSQPPLPNTDRMEASFRPVEQIIRNSRSPGTRGSLPSRTTAR
jgi:integrase